MNWRAIVVIRGEVRVVEILRVFDSIDVHDMLLLRRSALHCRSGRRRFLMGLDEFAPRILAPFGLGQIASGYVNDLRRTHLINFQLLIGSLS
jgi:hypothetical protein